MQAAAMGGGKDITVTVVQVAICNSNDEFFYLK